MKTTETNHEGECVCGRGRAQRRAFRKPAQVHMVTSAEVHGPRERMPFLPRVSGSPLHSHTGKPNPWVTSHGTLQGSWWVSPRHTRTVPVCDSSPSSTQHASRCPSTCFSLSHLWHRRGYRELARSGARLPSVTS